MSSHFLLVLRWIIRPFTYDLNDIIIIFLSVLFSRKILLMILSESIWMDFLWGPETLSKTQNWIKDALKLKSCEFQAIKFHGISFNFSVLSLLYLNQISDNVLELITVNFFVGCKKPKPWTLRLFSKLFSTWILLKISLPYLLHFPLKNLLPLKFQQL